MQVALMGIFWSLVGKLGAKFFANVIIAGLKEWSSHTENKFDDAVAEAFRQAWEGVPEK
jgi:hypothetical protein